MATETQHRIAHDKAMEVANKVWDDLMGAGRRQAKMKVYKATQPTNAQRARDMYFYTSEKVMRNGRLAYASGIYRFRQNKKGWVLYREATHSKKEAAISRAKRLAEHNK